MNDDHFDDLELASAYLDGAVTDDERARVEADPELLALVEELRLARDAVAHVEPPSDQARESAIAAALAAFDTEMSASTSETSAAAGATPGTTSPAPPPNVVPIERARRWRWTHGLSVAAAALIVVAGGVALLRDDAEAPSDNVAREQQPPALTQSMEAEAPGGATADVGAGFGTAAPDADANEDLATMAAEAPEPDTAADELPGAVAPPAAAQPAPTLAARPATTVAPLERLAGVAQFAAYAEELAAERGPFPDPKDLRDRCRDGLDDPALEPLTADAVYVDEDGVAYQIAIVDDNGTAAGLDVATCDLVVEADDD